MLTLIQTKKIQKKIKLIFGQENEKCLRFLNYTFGVGFPMILLESNTGCISVI